MLFSIEETVGFALDEVYFAYRDHLPDLVPFMPNVDRIEVLDRRQTPGGVALVNRWWVSAAVPRVARRFLEADQLSYLDHANWDDEQRCVRWRFEIGVFPGAVSCAGEHRFEGASTVDAERARTRVIFGGDLSVDLSRVRGVPRLLHRFAPRVERYLIGEVRPNLTAVSTAVGAYLEARQGAAAGR